VFLFFSGAGRDARPTSEAEHRKENRSNVLVGTARDDLGPIAGAERGKNAAIEGFSE
jgi:hypothetical protein